MPKQIPLFVILFLFVFNTNAQTKKAAPKKTTGSSAPATTSGLKTTNDSLSYAFGISLAQYMKSQGITNINYIMLTKAISQTLKGETPLIDMNTANSLMGRLAENKSKEACASEKERGRLFLEENKKFKPSHSSF